MQRKSIYSIAFASLLIIAAVFVFTDRKSTIRRGQMNFALENPLLVDKIIIKNKVNQILIEKHINKWRLNGNYSAKPETVRMFLQALGRIEVRSPASKSIRESISRKLEDEGIHLILYQGNKILRSILVYYEMESIPGTYMMDEHVKKPYLTGLTGYEGDNFINLFSLKEAAWKDNVLFDYRPDDIASVEMEYPQQPERSFSITNKAKEALQIYAHGRAISTDSVDMEKGRDYLSFFNAVHYTQSGDVNFNHGRFSDPFVVLTITDNKQGVFHMKAFKIAMPDEQSFDMNRYIAIVGDDSLPVVVKYSDTDPIMKSCIDFLKK